MKLNAIKAHSLN